MSATSDAIMLDDTCMSIETVCVDIDATHPYAGDLLVQLTSPNGYRAVGEGLSTCSHVVVCKTLGCGKNR